MKQNTYRICSKCGNENSADANFCLNCGTALSDNNNFVLTAHSSDLDFPLVDLELSVEEEVKAKKLVITFEAIPAGCQSQGLVFAESSVEGNSPLKFAWQDMMKNLYELLLAKHYDGAAHVNIQKLTNNAFYLTAEAFVQN